MQPGFRIIFTYITIAVLIVLLVFTLPARTAEKPEASEPCCLKTEGTCTEPGKGSSDDLMLENLSRQFILVSPLN